jgi:PIN domain nuclease of toxin-antitoxin system
MDAPQLSKKARDIISGGRIEIYLSAVCTWEITIKYHKGRLILPESPEKYILSRMHYYHFLPLPIHINHTTKIYSLPNHHNDPFDRLLIAQCQSENMAIMSSDENIAKYEVEVIW